jgi:broad specificity phosphatase PhoE
MSERRRDCVPLRVLLLALCAILATSAAAQEADPLVALRQGAAVALVRHATAPGTGDPANFRLGDCSTQRNLSEAGRSEARALGERLRDAGIAEAQVYSSQWCRCLETAELLGLGEVEPLPILNSFFSDRSRGPGQTEALRRLIAESDDGPPRLFVTHQVNISALAGVFPRSGEIVVVSVDKPGRLVGRLPPR